MELEGVVGLDFLAVGLLVIVVEEDEPVDSEDALGFDVLAFEAQGPLPGHISFQVEALDDERVAVAFLGR